MSYETVCRELGVPTIDVTLRAARLKFLQSMTRDPKHHQLFWSCILGKYQFEEEAQTNPWSEQYCADLMDLKHFDGVETLCSKLQDEFSEKEGQALKILIGNEECRRENSSNSP